MVLEKRNGNAPDPDGRRSNLVEGLGEVERNNARSHDYEANNPDEDDENCLTSKLMLGSQPSQQRMKDAGEGHAEGQHMTCCVLDGFGLRLSPFLLLLIFIYCNLLNFVDR
jgi:hypothetical protein